MSCRKSKLRGKRWEFLEGVASGLAFAALMIGLLIFMLAW